MAAGYVLDNFGPILLYILSFFLHIIIFPNLFGTPTLLRQREGVDACAFLETFFNMVNSHQDPLVCLNIPAVITCQGDIPELGHDGCVFLNFSRWLCLPFSFCSIFF